MTPPPPLPTEAARWRDRVVLVLIVLAVGSSLPRLVDADESGAEVAPADRCLTDVTERARAFAAVLGDPRPVPRAFAERSCRRPADAG